MELSALKRKVKKISTLIVLFGLLAVLFTPMVGASSWWDNSWGYRVTNPIADGARPYQLSLNISSENGTNNATWIFTNGHNATNFDDVRFTLDNTTELAYWIEDNSTDPIVAWVNVTANGTVNCYYNATGVESASDGDATFEFFDSFTYLDSPTNHGWITVNDGVWAIEAGELSQSDVTAGQFRWLIYNDATFDDNILMQVKIRRISGNKTGGQTIHYQDTANYYRNMIQNNVLTQYLSVVIAGGYDQDTQASNLGPTFKSFKIWKLSDGSLKGSVDDGAQLSRTDATFSSGKIGLFTYEAHCHFDDVIVRKFTSPEPQWATWGAGEELVLEYIPPNPTNLQNTTGNFYVNHTWDVGAGNVTDSFNVSVNDSWSNGSANTFHNNSGLSPHDWSNVTVWAFNTSGSGSLSDGNVTDDVQIPNNAITLTVTQTYNVDEGETVFISDASSSDLDGDTPTYSCNRTDLFTDFSTATGKGNWTTTYVDAGTYYVDVGVGDGYGSTNNKTLTIAVSDVPGVAVVPDSVVQRMYIEEFLERPLVEKVLGIGYILVGIIGLLILQLIGLTSVHLTSLLIGGFLGYFAPYFLMIQKLFTNPYIFDSVSPFSSVVPLELWGYTIIPQNIIGFDMGIVLSIGLYSLMCAWVVDGFVEG